MFDSQATTVVYRIYIYVFLYRDNYAHKRGTFSSNVLAKLKCHGISGICGKQ